MIESLQCLSHLDLEAGGGSILVKLDLLDGELLCEFGDIRGEPSIQGECCHIFTRPKHNNQVGLGIDWAV